MNNRQHYGSDMSVRDGRSDTVLRLLNIGLYTCTPDGTVIAIDETAAALFGLTEEQRCALHGASLSSMLEISSDAQDETAILKRTVREGSLRNVCTRVGGSDGKKTALIRNLFFDDTDSDNQQIHVSVNPASEAFVSERKYRQFAETARDIILTLDMSGRVTYINQAGARMIGRRFDKIVGMHITDLVSPASRNAIRRRLRRRQTMESAYFFYETEMLDKNGESVPVEVNSSLLIENDNPTGILVFARDASDRLRVIRALRESEEKYRTLVDISPAGVFLETVEGEILDCNDSACRMLGYTKNELIGLNAADIVPDEIATHFDELNFADPSLSDELISSASKRKDGSILPCEVSMRHVNFGGETRILVYVHDMTRYAEAERALKESEEKYRLVVENANEGIIVIQDHILRFANDRALELAGYADQSISGIHYLDPVHPDDRDAVHVHFEQLMHNRNTIARITCRILDNRGTTKWVEMGSVSIMWEDQPAILSFVNDITDRRELERQLAQAQKMEAIGRLAGGIAHDFNNILTIISGYARLLRQHSGTGQTVLTYAEEISKATNSAAELTSRLLTFSRKNTVNPVVMNLNGVISDFEQFLRRTIGEHIALQVSFDDSIDNITADPGQIEQIMLNLATNARDAMPDGGLLRIETRNATQQETQALMSSLGTASFVVLSVSDTGIGMDEKTRELIFEPFFTTKEESGTGLGLATVYGIIHQHGGQIVCESEPGRGTTFTIFLPGIDRPAQSHRQERNSRGEIKGGSETILVVEDDEAILRLAEEALKDRGYHVLTAVNADEALIEEENHPATIHMLLTDIMLPGRSGKQLADILTKKRPETAVLYTSGYTDNVVVQRNVLNTSADFLRKPYDISDLLSRVRDVLDRNR